MSSSNFFGNPSQGRITPSNEFVKQFTALGYRHDEILIEIFVREVRSSSGLWLSCTNKPDLLLVRWCSSERCHENLSIRARAQLAVNILNPVDLQGEALSHVVGKDLGTRFRFGRRGINETTTPVGNLLSGTSEYCDRWWVQDPSIHWEPGESAGWWTMD